VQGASGVHIKDVIAAEIARPLGIDKEMYVGIPDGVENRLATLGAMPAPPPGAPQIPPDHEMFKAMPTQQDFTYNELRVRKACLPSANGHFSARALARMYAALANGGEVDGVRLVSPERIPLMQRVLVESPDRVIMMAIPKGVGYFMGGAEGVGEAIGPRRTAFGHPGAGGSIGFADPEVGLSVAVTVNQMHSGLQGEGPVTEICKVIRAELGVA
jgi:CubicO group peptidase (beta-lactamase class C family)